jgi:hypothetical protein
MNAWASVVHNIWVLPDSGRLRLFNVKKNTFAAESSLKASSSERKEN